LGYGKRRERVWCGAAGQHHRVPAMGRGTCLGKRRGWGGGTGAEDGESREETARNGAAACPGTVAGGGVRAGEGAGDVVRAGGFVQAGE
jgi:hypothetical protein